MVEELIDKWDLREISITTVNKHYWDTDVRNLHAHACVSYPYVIQLRIDQMFDIKNYKLFGRCFLANYAYFYKYSPLPLEIVVYW
jgi:hypothetical protein